MGDAAMAFEEPGHQALGRHLVYRVIRPDGQLPGFVLRTLGTLAPQFETVNLLVHPAADAAVTEQLGAIQELEHVHVTPFKYSRHAGKSLLHAASLIPADDKLVLLDDALTGSTASAPDALDRLSAMPGPVKALLPFGGSGPLSPGGGCLDAQPRWLKLKPVRKVLTSSASASWSGLGQELRSVSGGRVPVLFGGTPTAEIALTGSGLRSAIAEGVPVLPWTAFTADPLALAEEGIDSTVAFKYLTDSGVPSRELWDHLLRTVEPQVWHANMRMLSITDPEDPLDETPTVESERSLSTAIIMHVFYEDMLEEMTNYAANVPAPASLFVTTDTEEKAAKMRESLSTNPHFASVDVRVVGSNQGRDIPAFLIDCADVLRDPNYDLVIKLHSKKSAQTPAAMGQYFKDHLFDNLVGTPSQAAQIKALFAAEDQLGLVFPPMIHVGNPTMGNGWFTNKPPAFRVAARLGFELHDPTFPLQPDVKLSDSPRAPADPVSPLAPYGSMFWARREALLPLADADFQYEEFPTNDAYVDGSLAHILERLFAYTVYSRGYYARTVETLSNAQFSGAALERKLGAIDELLPVRATSQVKIISKSLPFSFERLGRHGYATLVRFSPATGKLAKRTWQAVKPFAGALGWRGE